MKGIILLAATLAALGWTAGLAADAGDRRLKVRFDVIDSARLGSNRQEILDTIANLSRRKFSDKFQFHAGGEFTVPPYTEETFFVREPGADLELSLAWKPAGTAAKPRMNLKYRARLAYPMQPEFSRLERTVDIAPGETLFISDTETAQGTQDTRPVYVILRVEQPMTAYAFPGLGAIGARIEVIGGYPVIAEALAGGPAKEAGLETGDEIREINGYSTLQQSIDQVMKHIRGDPGTRVTMQVYRRSRKKIEEVWLTRRIVE